VIVDTSILVAMVKGESDVHLYVDALMRAGSPRLSAANYFEFAMVVDKLGSPAFSRRVDEIVWEFGLVIVSVSRDQAQIARQAYQRFGKGRHPAALNFGDCFAYALAKETGEPLLYKGTDFKLTDIVGVL
jgi:ribonuclease VapC